MSRFMCSKATLKLLKDNVPVEVEMPPGPMLRTDTIHITASDFIPDRRWDERWVPPPAGRFTELGPEDECWARDLGLGHVEKIDIGPLVIQFNEHAMRELMKPMSMPVGILMGDETRFSSSTAADMASIEDIVRRMRFMW